MIEVSKMTRCRCTDTVQSGNHVLLLLNYTVNY